MSKTMVSKLINNNGFNVDKSNLLGVTFGLFTSESSLAVRNDLKTEVSFNNDVIFPLMTFVSNLTNEEKDTLGLVENNSTALFVMDNDTLLLGESDDVVLLPVVVELQENFKELSVGTQLFISDEGFDDSFETISAYTKDGKSFDLPLEIFKVVNFK